MRVLSGRRALVAAALVLGTVGGARAQGPVRRLARRAGASIRCASRWTRTSARSTSALAKMESTSGNRDALLELSSQLEGNAQARLARAMRGQVEVIANQGRRRRIKRQKDFYLDMDTRFAQARAGGRADRRAEAQARGRGGNRRRARTRPTRRRSTNSSWGTTRWRCPPCRAFLVTYPTSSLAANAQYWVRHGVLRTARLQERDRRAAQAAADLAGQPEGPPDAMLSIASAQETMGDRKAAQKNPGRPRRQVSFELRGP